MSARVVVGLSLLIVACSPSPSKEQHFEAGQRLLHEGRAGEAIVELRNALAGDDRWGEARYQLAEAYAASNDHEHAYREYLRAADLMPANATAQLKAISYLLLVDQFEDAKTRATRLLQIEPANVEAHIALGNAFAGLRDLGQAVGQLEEAMRLDPKQSRGHTSLGLIRAAQGQRDAARAAFERAVEVDDQSVPAKLALANFQWSEGRRAEAERTLRRALELDAENELTNRSLATLYLETGRASLAEDYFRALARLNKTPDAQLRLADYYAAYNRADEARAILIVLRQQPAMASAASVRLADLEYAAGERDRARQMLDEVLAREPNHAMAQLLMARWLIDEGHPEDALERARMATAAYPRLLAAHYVQGLAQARTRRINEAIKSFTEVLRLNPRAVEAQIQLSGLHLLQQSIASAVQLADEAVANAPNNFEARYAQVRAWIAAGAVGRAQQALAELDRRAPENSALHELHGALNMREGRFVPARRSYERALQLEPLSSAALLGLARLARTLDEKRAVIAKLRDRAGSTTPDPELLLASARLSLSTGDRATAERELRAAIDRDPLDVATFGLLVQIYREENRLDAARREFDDAARREPSNVAPKAIAAVISHAMGEIADARRRYEEVLRTNARLPVVANNLAVIYADAGENLDIARQLIATALEQQPRNLDFRDTLGWVFYRSKQYGPAVAELEQVVARAPGKADVRYHLGLAYAKTGDTERAKTALSMAIILQPPYLEAESALRALSQSSAAQAARTP